MMPTANYGWTYPAPGSTVDVPRDIQSLADQIDATAKTRLNPPYVQVKSVISQNILHGDQVPINFTSEDFDTHGMHSTTVDTHRLTATIAGVYQVWGGCSFSQNSAGRRIVFINFRDVGIMCNVFPAPGAGLGQYPAPTIVLRLAVGDWVSMVVQHEAGSGVILGTGTTSYNRPYLGALWVGP